MPVTSAVVTGCESSVASIEPEKDFEEPCREISLARLRIVDYEHECGEQDGSASLVGLVNPTHTHQLSRDIGILDFFFLFRFTGYFLISRLRVRLEGIYMAGFQRAPPRRLYI